MTCSNNKQPKVGDTVVIRGTITKEWGGSNNKSGHFNISFPDGTTTSIFGCQIEEIIPKPWEPKIGEEVDLRGRISVRDHGFTLLNVHGDGGSFHDGSIRKWATVAFLNDKPEVVLYSHILQRGTQ